MLYTSMYMANHYLDEKLKNYLLSAYPIDESLLDHLVEDIGEYYSLDVKEFIAKRHELLHRNGAKNEQIYKQIQKELKERWFSGPSMTVRQIRRVIYG